MLKNLSIRNKVLIGFVAPITLLISVAIGVYIYSHKVLDTFNWVIHTQQVISQVENLTADLVNMETGERGFLFTGE